MAIGRLLSPKLSAHFSSRGSIPLTRRWFSSSLEDDRKYERLPVSEASSNKDIGQKRMHWYSLGGLLTILKQKITGNVFLINKTSGDDSVSPKSPMVSSSDVTATKVVSLQNVAENKNCISSSIKEESSVSEMGFQGASQSVAAENKNCITSSIKEESSVPETETQHASISVVGIKTSGKRESISVNQERLNNIKRLDGLQFAPENVLKGKEVKRVDSPQELSSKDVSTVSLIGEVSESLASSGENQGKLQPKKGQPHQAKPPQNRLSKYFINSEPDKEVKLPLRFEAMSNSNSSMSTRESCSDVGDLHGLVGNSSMVSSSVVTATKVFSLQNVAENKNCISLSIKEESSVSEMGFQGASRSVASESKNCITSSIKEESSVSEMGTQHASTSVARIKTSGKRERISVNQERFNNIKRLDGLQFAPENVLKGKQAKRVDSPQELSSKDVSIISLIDEVSESLESSGENQGKLLPVKGQPHQAKPPQNRLSKYFINSDPDKMVKLPLILEALSNSNSSMSTRESCSDVGDLHGLVGNSSMVSSSDVTATKVVSLQNVAENKNCISSSIKEESPVSEMGVQGAIQSVASESKNCITSSIKEECSVSGMGTQHASTSVAGIKTSGKRERISVNQERFNNIKRLDSLQVAPENVLKGKQAKRVDSPQELSSKDVSMVYLIDEVSESLASSGENQGKLQPEKGQPDHAKPPQNRLSKYFMFTGESSSDVSDLHGLVGKSLSDPVPNIKSISYENDKHRLLGEPENPYPLASILLRGTSHDQKSGDLAAIRERENTFSFESSTKTVVPVALSRDMSMKKMMDSPNLPTSNSADADANSWIPNGGEGKCVSKDNSVSKTTDRICATEERESKWETFDLQNKALCNQVTLATTTKNPKVTKKSLFTLSVGERSPNKVLLRFLKETCEKQDIADSLSKFGAVLDVQEITSFERCYYKDALVTFETNLAAKMALKKAFVWVKNQNVVVEETSQEDMAEQICIPDLIGDPDVPIALVKEPTRTVKIHPLEHDIGSNQIKEALQFCRSDISKIILSSSKTAAFVEFETEDGKERALAEHIISILNKQLFISRIDVPRTTVARIANLSESAKRDIFNLCKPYGQIKQVFHRGKYIIDVHFEVSEWPNMLTILNSLNGKKIDGMKLVVRPATVIPPEILKALWEDPQEKRYVESVIQNLVREIGKPLDLSRSHALVRDILQ